MALLYRNRHFSEACYNEVKMNYRNDPKFSDR